jgi:hypothetical protein
VIIFGIANRVLGMVAEGVLSCYLTESGRDQAGAEIQPQSGCRSSAGVGHNGSSHDFFVGIEKLMLSRDRELLE